MAENEGDPAHDTNPATDAGYVPTSQVTDGDTEMDDALDLVPTPPSPTPSATPQQTTPPPTVHPPRPTTPPAAPAPAQVPAQAPATPLNPPEKVFSLEGLGIKAPVLRKTIRGNTDTIAGFAYKPVTPAIPLVLPGLPRPATPPQAKSTKRRCPDSPGGPELPILGGLGEEEKTARLLRSALAALEGAQKIRPLFKELISGTRKAISQLSFGPSALPSSTPASAQSGLGASKWKGAPQAKEAPVKAGKEALKKAEKKKKATFAEVLSAEALAAPTRIPAPTRTLPAQPALKPALKPAPKPTQTQARTPALQTSNRKAPARAPASKKKSPTEGCQLILKLARQQQPTFDSFALRNQVNAALGEIAVIRIERSDRGNIVITTKQPFSAKQLLAAKSKWAPAFNGFAIQSADLPTSWVKLVAHNVPVLTNGDVLGLFPEEAKVFNGIETVGAPRWLKQPREGQRTGSVVFAVPSEELGARCRKQGLCIAGILTRVEAYKAFTIRTQCYRCLGFGHNPGTCRKQVRCAFCPERHLTRDHSCPTCKSSQACSHFQAYCYNCKGNHRTTDKSSCGTFKALSNV